MTVHQGQHSHQPTGKPTMLLASSGMPRRWWLAAHLVRPPIGSRLANTAQGHEWLNLPVHRPSLKASCTGLPFHAAAMRPSSLLQSATSHALAAVQLL